MNKEGMSKMNRFLIIIAIILMIIVVCLALGIYYVKSTNNSDWSLPKYSISGNAVYEYENHSDNILNVCKEGQRICFGPGYIECQKVKGGLNWGVLKLCDKNEKCLRGRCVNE